MATNDQTRGGPPGREREAESEPFKRIRRLRYVSVSVHMPEASSAGLRELAESSGLAFKHLTSVALAIGVRRLREELRLGLPESVTGRVLRERLQAIQEPWILDWFYALRRAAEYPTASGRSQAEQTEPAA